MDRQRNGFTMMEAVVALAVFTVGMLGLAGAFSQIIRANAISRHEQMSAFLAGRQMTRMQIAGLGDLARTKGTFEAPFEGYTWETQFAPRPEDPEVVDVWIEVKHQSGPGTRLWSQIVVVDDR